jgi:DNA-binding NtrC family response regulator
MARVLSLIEKAAPTQANILILGENGTGKELVAREVHRQSRRAEASLLTVDLGAVAESLFDSELFGHVKGAFTDARADRVGRLQAAEEGRSSLTKWAICRCISSPSCSPRWSSAR